MEYSEEIRCPKCNSNQLTSNQKGFSAGKAIGGALLTGGVGLFAGFIGSKKVLITCLKCGKNFKAGEGKIVRIPINTNNSFETYSSGKPKTSVGEVRLLTTIEEIRNAPIVWSEEQLIARNKKALTPEELEIKNKPDGTGQSITKSYSQMSLEASRRIKTVDVVKKELTPEELEIKNKQAFERQQRIIELEKGKRINRVSYMIITILFATFPLYFFFNKSLNSDFGFFFGMLFIFGSIITFFILKLIWDSTK